MDDADVFNADPVLGKEGGNGSQSSRFVRNIGSEGVGFLNGTAGCLRKGIAVGLCPLEEAVKGIGVFPLQFPAQKGKGADVIIQQPEDIVRIGQTDLLPHAGGGGGNPRNVLKAAGGNCFHDAVTGIAVLYQMDKGGGDGAGG